MERRASNDLYFKSFIMTGEIERKELFISIEVENIRESILKLRKADQIKDYKIYPL